MLTIQEVGNEILTNQPRKFYVFCGAESGIKDKYIAQLQSYYGNKIEVDSMDSLLTQFQVPAVISVPTLYVVRYDKEFLSKLSATTAETINNLYIDGTVVCIYAETASSKINKYLGDYAIDLIPLTDQLKLKYLSTEFPTINTIILELVIQASGSYLAAKNICTGLSTLPNSIINELSLTDIKQLFVIDSGISETIIGNDIYARNVGKALSDLTAYTGDLNYLFYNLLNTMTTLEKQNNKGWSKSDIVAFNDLVYQFLLYSRTNYANLYNALAILCGAVGISPISAIGGIA